MLLTCEDREEVCPSVVVELCLVPPRPTTGTSRRAAGARGLRVGSQHRSREAGSSPQRAASGSDHRSARRAVYGRWRAAVATSAASARGGRHEQRATRARRRSDSPAAAQPIRGSVLRDDRDRHQRVVVVVGAARFASTPHEFSRAPPRAAAAACRRRRRRQRLRAPASSASSHAAPPGRPPPCRRVAAAALAAARRAREQRSEKRGRLRRRPIAALASARAQLSGVKPRHSAPCSTP